MWALHIKTASEFATQKAQMKTKLPGQQTLLESGKSLEFDSSHCKSGGRLRWAKKKQKKTKNLEEYS